MAFTVDADKCVTDSLWRMIGNPDSSQYLGYPTFFYAAALLILVILDWPRIQSVA